MADNKEALPVWAYAYAEEHFGRIVVRFSGEKTEGSHELVLKKDATAALSELRAEVERLRVDAERYRFLRGFASPRSKPLPDDMPLSYYPVRLRCDTAVYSPSTWGADVDRLVDAARSAASGESAEGGG